MCPQDTQVYILCNIFVYFFHSNIICLGIIFSCFVAYSVIVYNIVTVTKQTAVHLSGGADYILQENEIISFPLCESWRSNSLQAIQTTSNSLKSAWQIYTDLKLHTEQSGKKK